ncbi:MAG TPA: hypothetical protein VE913_02280 [Longimicrobium sp.]|nr:hypothetical protein [Longimicrobium sp.]
MGSDGTRAWDRVYGGVAAAMVALALFFLIRGGPADSGAAATPAPPPALTLVEPRDGAEVSGPLAVVFDAGVALEAGPMGPHSDGRHVHLRVAGTELMAGTADVKPAGGTRYRWTVPTLPAGEHTLQLLWSDAAHKPLRAGASARVAVRVR